MMPHGLLLPRGYFSRFGLCPPACTYGSTYMPVNTESGKGLACQVERSPPTGWHFTAHIHDRPGGEGLAARVRSGCGLRRAGGLDGEQLVINCTHTRSHCTKQNILNRRLLAIYITVDSSITHAQLVNHKFPDGLAGLTMLQSINWVNRTVNAPIQFRSEV